METTKIYVYKEQQASFYVFQSINRVNTNFLCRYLCNAIQIVMEHALRIVFIEYNFMPFFCDKNKNDSERNNINSR